MSDGADDLAGCVEDDCFNPAATWCGGRLLKCQSESLGCWYKLLCSSACVCSNWKTTFCGGETRNTPCPASLVQAAKLAQNGSAGRDLIRKALLEVNAGQAHRENGTSAAGVESSMDSLEESLTGKRTCR